jgi:hypothetical protein
MKKLLLLLVSAFLFLNACRREISSTNEIFTKIYSKANLPTSIFNINSERDTLLCGKSGTKVFVRKNTFVDQAGNSVTGSVALELREAITNEDIVLGNMTTLTNGQILQSGGMVYLNASMNNVPLAIGKGNAIDVSVPSTEKRDGMQIYSAEIDSATTTINWVNPKNEVIVLKMSDTLSNTSIVEKQVKRTHAKALPRNTEVDSASTLPVAPKMPEQITAGRDTVITLEFDPIDFPELAEYKNVKFVLKNCPNYDPKNASSTWTSVVLKEGDEEGIYMMTLSTYIGDNPREVTYRVAPAFEGKDYKKAVEVYKQKFAAYENAKKEIAEIKAQQELKDKMEMEAAMLKYRKDSVLRAEEIKKEIENQKLAAEARRVAAEQVVDNTFQSGSSGLNVYLAQNAINNYVFQVKNLGWSNVDRLYSDPRTRDVNIITEINNSNEYDQVYISLLFDSQKIYIPAFQGSGGDYFFGHNQYEQIKLPVGEQATIFATAYKGGVPYLLVKKIIIQEQQNFKLDLQPTTLKELKTQIRNSI